MRRWIPGNRRQDRTAEEELGKRPSGPLLCLPPAPAERRLGGSEEPLSVLPLAAAAAAGRWACSPAAPSPAEELKVRAGPGVRGKAAPGSRRAGARLLLRRGTLRPLPGTEMDSEIPRERRLRASRGGARAAPERGVGDGLVGGQASRWIRASPPGSAPALAAARAGGEAWDPPRKPCPLGLAVWGDGGRPGGVVTGWRRRSSSTSRPPGAGDAGGQQRRGGGGGGGAHSDG